MTIIDINENKDIPSLAEMLYEIYSADSIPFTINTSKKVIEFLNELYPNMPQTEREKMIQVLKLEIIAKFCLYAESLGAIAIPFTSSYDDVKKEMMGLFRQVGKYNVNQVIDFYENISKRDVQYVAKFIGYPPLILQSKQVKELLESSCLIIKDEIKRISDLYLEFRSLYNAYKHGYRVFFGKDEKLNDAFAFFEKDAKQKSIVIDQSKLEEINRAVRHIRRIIELIFDTHKERIKYENGIKKLSIHIMSLSHDSIKVDPEKKLHYPSRGEQFKIDDDDFKQVYSLHKDELETSHLGKYIAIDIDDKKIVGVDENLERLIEKMAEMTSSGRKRIAKIGGGETNRYEMY